MQARWINLFRSKRAIKIYKWLSIFFGGLTVLFIIFWLIFRGTILNYAWNKAEKSLESKHYVLRCHQKSFVGLFDIEIQQLALHSANDTLVSIQKIVAEIDVWRSLWNGPTLEELTLNKTNIALVKNKNYCNFCALLPKGGKKTVEKKPTAQKIFDIIRSGFSKMPACIELTEFKATFRDSGSLLGVNIPQMEYLNKKLSGTIRILENDLNTGFAISGEINRKSITGKLTVKPEKGKWVVLPFLQRKWNLSAGFKEADFALETFDMSNGVLDLVADGHFVGITIDDRRMADTTVVVNDCSGKIVAHFGKDFIEIDSATSLSLNKINTYLYARADLGSHKKYALQFRANKIAAQDFFTSLPEGMFQNLKGLQTAGQLEYAMRLSLDDKEPWKCEFDSKLTPYNFKIIKMGETDLRKLNGSFVHTFYERGKPVRSFVVGPSNASFTPLDDIPELLKKAVMTGEDPAFYNHNGFYQEAIRQSIAQNYVQKKFARGGSTISMQLVKNAFLSRRKTLARKAEEILIVWLIESQHLTSKARMFEVYLNIIEWGPGVHGIGEAAPFYFGKSPYQLEPLECAFLASIVPMPKHYRYFLDSTGQVSERNWNFVAIRNNMIKRGDLDAADSASFNVTITGPAVRYLKTAPKDSMSEIEMEEPISDFLVPRRKD